MMEHVQSIKHTRRWRISPSLPRRACAQHLVIEVVPVVPERLILQVQHLMHYRPELTRVWDRDPGARLERELKQPDVRVLKSVSRVLIEGATLTRFDVLGDRDRWVIS